MFAEHFKKLYGHTATFDPSVIDLLQQRDVTPELDHLPTDEEIRRAVGRLHDTAPGESGVAAPLFKALITTRVGFDLVRQMVLQFGRRARCRTHGRRAYSPFFPRRAT